MVRACFVLILLTYLLVFVSFFFFSSRRRHTRYWRDWSSDVCSSDLSRRCPALSSPRRRFPNRCRIVGPASATSGMGAIYAIERSLKDAGLDARSEERRVGKECRSRWWPEQ